MSEPTKGTILAAEIRRGHQERKRKLLFVTAQSETTLVKCQYCKANGHTVKECPDLKELDDLLG